MKRKAAHRIPVQAPALPSLKRKNLQVWERRHLRLQIARQVIVVQNHILKALHENFPMTGTVTPPMIFSIQIELHMLRSFLRKQTCLKTEFRVLQRLQFPPLPPSMRGISMASFWVVLAMDHIYTFGNLESPLTSNNLHQLVLVLIFWWAPNS